MATEIERQRYVVGFLFFGPNVVLLKKNRLQWQAGLLNGVGGKIEPPETPLQAMDRKCTEEIGLSGISWNHFADLVGDDFVVHAFCAALDRWDERVPRLPRFNEVGEEVCLIRSELFCVVPHVANVPALVALARVWPSFRFATISYGVNGAADQQAREERHG